MAVISCGPLLSPSVEVSIAGESAIDCAPLGTPGNTGIPLVMMWEWTTVCRGANIRACNSMLIMVEIGEAEYTFPSFIRV